mgnify:CR=1 FL=1
MGDSPDHVLKVSRDNEGSNDGAEDIGVGGVFVVRTPVLFHMFANELALGTFTSVALFKVLIKLTIIDDWDATANEALVDVFLLPRFTITDAVNDVCRKENNFFIISETPKKPATMDRLLMLFRSRMNSDIGVPGSRT